MKRAFIAIVSVICCAGAARADMPFVQESARSGGYDLTIDGENLVVNVPAGFATGKALVLAWDAEDRGKSLFDWTHRQVLTSSVPTTGACFSCSLSAVAAEGAEVLRAFTADELVVLERLQMTSNKCYINTGVKDSNCSRVAFSYYQTGQSGSWGGVIGCSGEYSFAVGMNNAVQNSWCWWYGTMGKASGSASQPRPSVYTDRPNEVDFDNGTFNLNGAVVCSGLGVPVGDKNLDIYIGTSTQIGSRFAYGWWYYVRLWDLEGEPLIDYEPTKRVFDGAVGFYDRVSGNFVMSDAGGVFTAGEETEAREYLSDSETSPVLLDPTLIRSAVWTGAGDSSNLFDAANWTCTNFYGDEIADALPSNGITTVSISGTVAFSCTAGQVLPWRTATFGSCTLAGDADWSALGAYPAWLAEGATIDLAGHALTVEAPEGRESKTVVFTNRSASPAELHLVVSGGYAAYPQLTINGNLKLVKEGAGALYLARTDFTGGTAVAAGVLGGPATTMSAAAEPTFEEVDETGTVKMSVPSGWHAGEALFLVSDASAKGTDPFAWTVHQLVASVLPAAGAVFEFEPASLGLSAERPLYLLTATEIGLTDRLKMTSTGTWIDTGINDRQCTRVEFSFYQDGGWAGEGTWGGGVIGSLDEKSFAVSMSNGSATIWCWWYKGQKQGNRPTVSVTSPNVVDFNNGTFYINGQQWATDLGTPVGENGSRLYVGRASHSTRYCFGWWYYVRLWNGSTKLIDYVPVRRESDGRAAFYNQVSKTLVFSSGTGEFTAGTVTNRFYMAGQVGQPLALAATRVMTADWTGAGDPANLLDAANWTCRNLYGEVLPQTVPNRDYTQAKIQNEANFECPPGTEEPWLRLHVGPCALTRDHDWRGAQSLVVDDALNLGERTLSVSALAGSGKVSGAGTLRVDIPQGVTQVNSSLEVAGAVRLVKEGGGTYQPKFAQSYTGGTIVNAGTLALPVSGGASTAYSPNTMPLLGAVGSTLTVEAGATFDSAGNYDLYKYHTILNGGTYANKGANQENFASWSCNGNITLTADSQFVLNVGMALTDGTVDLGGHILTVNVANGCHFQWRGGCEVKNGKMVLPPSTGMFCLYVDEVVAPTVDLDIACNTEIKQPFTVHDYTMRRESSWSWSSAVTKVYGRFQPVTDHFTGVELQNGAVLDLTTKTGVWSNQSLDLNNAGNGGEFRYACNFAEGATIVVDVSGRRFPSGAQIVGWEGELANYDSLKFKLDSESRQRYAIQKQPTGLFVIPANLIIYVR